MAHRYWRIKITANNGNTSGQKVGICEVEMRATIGGPDQCDGGKPSASSESTGYEASKAFDNTTLVTQWLTNSSESVPSWALRYKFAAEVDVAEVVIWPPTTLTRAPKDFDIQFSDDGADWTTSFSVVGVTDWVLNKEKKFTA